MTFKMEKGCGKYAYTKQKVLEQRKALILHQTTILKIKKNTFMNIKPRDFIYTVNLSDKEEKEPEIRRIVHYDELLNYGFKIVKRVNYTYNIPTRYLYFLCRLQDRITDVEADGIPAGHSVEFDVANKRARLLGMGAGFGSGKSRWVDKYEKQVEEKELNPWRRDMDRFGNLSDVQKQVIKKIKVTELPIMISDQDEIVCIDVDSKDESVIGICGQRGSGKSFMSHGIIDRLHYKTDIRIGILNDILNETITWWKPWNKLDDDSVHWIRTLGKYNETALPLPIIYLYPNANDLFDVYKENDLGHRITFSFEHLIDNAENYLRDSKSWQLRPASMAAFKSLKVRLLNCKKFSDVQKLLKNIPKDKMDANIKNSIYRVLDSLYSKQLLDVNTPYVSKWKIKDLDTGKEELYPPFIACIILGIIPSLVTSQFQSKDYFPQYFRYIVKDIFNRQVHDTAFRDKKYRIWLFCDEITAVCQRRKETVATEVLKEVVTRGRPARMGLIWATQNPEKIIDEIYTNTTHLFTFRFVTKQQAKAVVDNYGLPEYRVKDILNLGKHECLATTSTKFIVYDSTGKKRVTSGEAFKGKSLMTYSSHKAPR